MFYFKALDICVQLYPSGSEEENKPSAIERLHSFQINCKPSDNMISNVHKTVNFVLMIHSPTLPASQFDV